MPEIKPMTVPGTHEKFLKFFQKHVPPNAKVLDLGGGMAPLRKRSIEPRQS